MLPFAVEIFKLKFYQEPPYEKLKHLLLKVLMAKDEIPD